MSFFNCSNTQAESAYLPEKSKASATINSANGQNLSISLGSKDKILTKGLICFFFIDAIHIL
jgi:hypothetical protein